ncbi:outer membrane lipoprotein [Bathymodiolus septemdierum thioautotrophic gill symbiont]|uniref:Outer membrane lipoprotein SlyB n=1 Tax=endosymbiont of Bathymodiolus septemdierum str. Myojin knoll TaxID=1303921 RepID=A0A0P0URS3_9GAMM|nr:glycine zipper domain-containing protein [Bathymodiolus septemdierum thioautotrophic gill symbiont]BAS67533.1 outer membrane lipoprotein SlyB [endosymbiont of Bathymodiolus septemdierum str. Myojin knoll]
MKNKVILLMLVVFLTSCQSSTNRFTQDERGANTYSSTETGQLSSVLEGNIISIKQVRLSGSKGMGSGIGTALGAVTGASVVGSDDSDKAAGAIIGGLLGAMAGRAIEENATADTGFEFLVKLSSDVIKAFVQKSKQGLRVGDQVYVLYGNGTARLTRK